MFNLQMIFVVPIELIFVDDLFEFRTILEEQR